MSPRAWVAALTVVLVVVLGACGGSSSTDKPAPSPRARDVRGRDVHDRRNSGGVTVRPRADRSARGRDLLATAAGQDRGPGRLVRRLPAGSLHPATHRADGGGVPAGPADAEAGAGACRCLRRGRGCSSASTSTTGCPGSPSSSCRARDRVAGRASWVRCDVAFVAMSSGVRPAWFTGSAEEMVLRHPEKVCGCCWTSTRSRRTTCCRALRQAARLRGHRSRAVPRGPPLLPDPASAPRQGGRLPGCLPQPRLPGPRHAGALATPRRDAWREPA